MSILARLRGVIHILRTGEEPKYLRFARWLVARYGEAEVNRILTTKKIPTIWDWMEGNELIYEAMRLSGALHQVSESRYWRCWVMLQQFQWHNTSHEVLLHDIRNNLEQMSPQQLVELSTSRRVV